MIPPRATLSSMTPGFIRAIDVAVDHPRGRLGLGHVDRDHVGAGRRSRRTAPAPRRTSAACSGVTNGSEPSTVIWSARARTAIACPILPRPTMPSVRPRSSWPVNCERFHSPRRIEASAAAVWRASPNMSASVCSAAAIVLPVGRVDDGDPGARRRVEVDVVDADARPADDDQPRAGGDHLGVGLDLAPDDERVVLGQDREDLLARQAELLVDLVVGAEEVDALLGEGLDDEDPHAVTATRTRAATSACWAAATAAPGWTSRPVLDRRLLEHADRGQDVVRRHRAEVAEPEDPALELALAAGEHEPVPLEGAVERLPVEGLGDPGRGDRLRGDRVRPRGARTRAPGGRRASSPARPRGAGTRRRPRPASGAAPRRPGTSRRPQASTGVSPAAAVSRWRLRSR